jgi:hypothetical protein
MEIVIGFGECCAIPRAEFILLNLSQAPVDSFTQNTRTLIGH